MERTQRDISEEWLVIEAQCGDADAWAMLIQLWERRIAGRVVRHLGTPNADVVQDVWVSMARCLRRLDDAARFGPWMYQIIDRRCADEIRRVSRVRKHPVAQPVEARQHDDDIELLRVALADINSEQRMLLSMHHGDGLSVRAIAYVLGIQQGTVKSRLYAAREALRERLERLERTNESKQND